VTEDADPAPDARRSRHWWGRRLVALLGLAVLLVASPTAAVKPSRQPPSRGDVMRILFTRDQPKAIENLVHAVHQTPAAMDLEGNRDRGSERGTFQLPQSQSKAVVPGQRGNRRRRRSRR
jgi:hypothetical protein